jgi:hypothetical protein
MKILLIVVLTSCAMVSARGSLRPPSVPLLLQSPEINVWSNSDTLQSSIPSRWEGSPADWVAIARVKGESFLLMGSPSPPWSATSLQVALQTSVIVRSTRTIYTFKASCASVNVTFTSPLLLDDWELLSRPAHYVTFSAACGTDEPCDLQIYFDVTAQVVVRDVSTAVQWSRVALDPVSREESLGPSSQLFSSEEALRIGGVSLAPLSDSKDTPNWGDVYLATAAASAGVSVNKTLNWVTLFCFAR